MAILFFTESMINLAYAVIDGDTAAAHALFDAISENMSRGATDEAIFYEILDEINGWGRSALKENVDNLKDLLLLTSRQVKDLPQFGRKSLKELRKALYRRGLALADEVPNPYNHWRR